ncbi:MAG: DUF2157 domain-containing protein [Verrucomicrobiaceae bacterium]|nr:DUF2157 domain-containing protein [Verrucomicrobiaceae bacterium]
MNASHHRWLHEQLPQWERDGLISAESARTLREKHAVDDTQPGLAQIVMGALGALLIGIGLISIIGFNWDEFSRPVRLLFAFLPLLGAQVVSLRILQRGGSAAAWMKETAALFQALATGACIALVSQIYNLGGAWPDFLFWWCVLSLPLAWIMRSGAVVVFYLIGIAEWSIHQCDAGKAWHDSALMYPVLLAGVMPFWPGWRLDRPLSVTLRWIMTISAICGLGAAAYFATQSHFEQRWSHGECTLWQMAFTAAMLALVPLNAVAVAAPSRHKPQIVLGFLFMLGFGVASTFLDSGEELLKGLRETAGVPWARGLMIVSAALALIAVMRKRWAVLSVASIVLTPALALPLGERGAAVVPWLMTLHLFLIGVTLIALELAGRRGAPRLGATLLCVLILARMFESELSLLAKGTAFILVGVAFLAFNMYMIRLRRA